MKVVFVSNLFPDESEPYRGIYNARLVHSLSAHCEIRVVSPRPSLPFRGAAPRIPRPEDAPQKPSFPMARYIPKIGSAFNHRLMAGSLRGTLRAIRQEFPFDVVIASWLFPDACGVSLLAREMEFPFVAVCQGSDAHQYLKNPTRRRIIVDYMSRAAAVVTRSNELARLLENAGISAAKLTTIYNGVDLDLFHPIDKSAAREALNLPLQDKIILYVGNFFPVKNPGLLARAYARLCRDHPDNRHRLVMIGDGPERKAVMQSFMGSGLEQTTRFPGRQPAETVARYMQAADLLCVPSENEGVPNVILEAFAAGLKVVATDVGGIPEILNQESLGRLTPSGKPDDLAAALAGELDQERDLSALTRHAQQFSWGETASGYMNALEKAASVAKV